MSRKPWEDPTELDLDPQVELWLAELDPGRSDPTYWVRFHRDAVVGARGVLARRRRVGDLTLTGTMSAWSRAVLPAALLAAALAGLLLARPAAPGASPAPAMVEDLLATGLGPSIPTVLQSEESSNVIFAEAAY